MRVSVPEMCEMCEDVPPELRLTCTDLEGLVIDDTFICIQCAQDMGKAVSWPTVKERIDP